MQGLDALLIERSPDFLVILDAEMRVVRASAGLRSAVPLVAAGEDFLRSLDDASQARLRQSLSLHHDATFSLSLELVHRGRERLISTTYRFFGVERPCTWTCRMAASAAFDRKGSGRPALRASATSRSRSSRR